MSARRHHLGVVLDGLLGLRGLAVLGCGAFIGFFCGTQYNAAVLMSAAIAWGAFPFAVMVTSQRGVQVGEPLPHSELPVDRRARAGIEIGVAATLFALAASGTAIAMMVRLDVSGMTAARAIGNALLVLVAVSPMAVVARRPRSLNGMVVVWVTWVLLVGLFMALVTVGDPPRWLGLGLIFVASSALALFGHRLSIPLRALEGSRVALSRPATPNLTLLLIKDTIAGSVRSFALPMGLSMGGLTELYFEEFVGWPLLAGAGYGLITFPLGLRMGAQAGAFFKLGAATELFPVSGRRLAVGTMVVPMALMVAGVLGTAWSGADLLVWEPVALPFGLLVAGGLGCMLASQAALVRGWQLSSGLLLIPPMGSFFILLGTGHFVEEGTGHLLSQYPNYAETVWVLALASVACALVVIVPALTSTRLRR